MALTFPSLSLRAPSSTPSPAPPALVIRQESRSAISSVNPPFVFACRRTLENVTLVCVTDVHVDLGVQAMERCASYMGFAEYKLFTSKPTDRHYAVKIPPINSLRDYNRFIIKDLHLYIQTEFVMIVQWDGYIINPGNWEDAFLNYDYIGAPWIGHPGMPNITVGNGGFSIRSRRLLTAASKLIPDEHSSLPEDVVFCLRYRCAFERAGFRFAPVDIASKFSKECSCSDTFGFHNYQTPLLAEQRISKIFYHSGDLGDILYALPTIKAMGGGILCMHPDVTNSMRPRASIDEGAFNFIAPFLRSQPYIHAVYNKHCACDYDMNTFRGHFFMPGDHNELNLVQRLYRTFRLNLPDSVSWLQAPNPISGDVIMHRSPRYQDPNFPWLKILKDLRGRHIQFIGYKEEYDAFVTAYGAKNLEYVKVSDMLELANRIAGARLYVANQSSPMAVAQGLGVNIIQEVSPEVPTCLLKNRTNCQYGYVPNSKLYAGKPVHFRSLARNCLFVLNLNSHMCDNTRDSFVAACKRWRCDFVEGTENLVGDQDLCFNKIAGIEKYVARHRVNRVLYMDSDMLIRADAPNPFELFKDPVKVYATPDAYKHWDAHRLSDHRRGVTDDWLRVVHDLLRWGVDIEMMVTTSPDWFINAGMFLFDPAHCKSEINAFLDGIPDYRVEGRVEQAMWNYILRARNKVVLVDQTWDYISPDVADGRMHSYVYHFTGDNQPVLRAALPTYDWKTIC